MLNCLCGGVWQNWHRRLKITSLKSYSAASIRSCYMYTVWLQCVSPITGAGHPKMKMSHMLWLWNLFWKVKFWKICSSFHKIRVNGDGWCSAWKIALKCPKWSIHLVCCSQSFFWSYLVALCGENTKI